MTAAAIDTPSAGNRPLAFPYNKWHSTQWTVNQAAALVLCSVEAAGRLGVPTDRWVFPLVGLESSHALSLLRRSDPHAWPAMGILGAAAAERIGRPVAEVDVVEVYSCFPAAVRVQQRELGIDPAATPTVTGGMAFAGGPFNNFVLQSMVPVADALRAGPGSLGMVTTVSGLLTKPGIGVWCAVPDGRPPLLGDLAEEAEAATGAVDVVPTLDGYRGEATVATYTVTYEGLTPVRTVALCDTEDGRRCIAVAEDRELAATAVGDELIGTRVRLDAGSLTPV
jgi:acetyl-CoA C-acetyltransferase